MNTKLHVDYTSIIKCNTPEYTSGTVGHICEFDFTSEWNGLEKVALFKGSKCTILVDVVNDKCIVPWKCLTEYGGVLIVGVCGTDVDNNIIIPTIYCTLGTIKKGTDHSGEEPLDPTPAIWDRLRAEIDELNEDIAEKLSDAPLDGQQYARKNGDWEEVQDGSADWDDITNKPSTFAPSSHTHTSSDITDLTIPTKTSDLSNDGDGTTAFLTQHQDISGKLDKSGGTMTGALAFNSSSTIWGADGIKSSNDKFRMSINSIGTLGIHSRVDSSNIDNAIVMRIGSDNIMRIGQTNVRPEADNVFSLGTATNTWKEIHGKTIYQDGEQVYTKPSTGIPKTDLASDVQTSLDKADNALQTHQSLDAYRTSAEQDVIDAAKLSDAPSDNKTYGRKNAAWVEVTGSGDADVFVCHMSGSDITTFEEVKAANTAGKVVLLYSNGRVYKLSSLDNSKALFTSSGGTTVYRIELTSYGWFSSSNVLLESETNKVTSISGDGNHTQYPDTAAVVSKINTKLGGKVSGVQLNGTDLTMDANKKVNIPMASTSAFGVVKIGAGMYIRDNGTLIVDYATSGHIDRRVPVTGTTGNPMPICQSHIDYAVKAAMCDGVGSAWTSSEQESARTRLGAYEKPSTGIPKSDLASAVQTSLNRADTLTDSYINGLIDAKIGEAIGGAY